MLLRTARAVLTHVGAPSIPAHTANNSGTANVINVWTGLPTTTDMDTALRLSSQPAGTNFYIAVSTDPAFPIGSCQYAGPFTPVSDTTSVYPSGALLRVAITGLSANTTYYHAIRVDDTVYTGMKGKFKTLPAIGTATNFEFGTASCLSSPTVGIGVLNSFLANRTGANFFMILGDWPYGSGTSEADYTSDALYTKDRDNILASMGSFHQNIACEYIHSDSEFLFAPREYAATGYDTQRQTAMSNIRRHVPMQNLRSATLTDDTAHYFVVGRVRFICCDSRYWMTDNAAADTSAKTILGSVQKAWLKSQFDAAYTAGQVVIWICDQPLVGDRSSGDDNWPVYQTERKEIFNYLRLKNMLGSVMFLAGDMHALGYHSGVDYSTVSSGTTGGVRVFQAAAVDGVASIKGGPYTVTYPPSGTGNVNQYGYVKVADAGGSSVTLTLQGFSYNGTTESQVLADQTVTLAIPTAPAAPSTPQPRQMSNYYMEGTTGIPASTSKTIEAVLAAAPIPGNLLLLYVVPDKDGTVTPPTGWTLVQGVNNAAQSGWLYKKVADGTEYIVAPTINQGTTGSSGEQAVVMEWAGFSDVDVSAINANGGATSTTNLATTPATTVANGVAVSFWSIDSEGSTSGGVTYTNGFTNILLLNDAPDIGGTANSSCVGVAVATKQLAASGSAVSTTVTAASDETTHVLVTLK